MNKTVLALALVLAGCASSNVNRQVDAINRGELGNAEQIAIASIRSGDDPARSWHNLGVVYERGGLPDKAAAAFTMGARYGNPASQQALVNMRRPVPATDLAGSNKSSDDAWANALNGFNRGYSGGISCTTMGGMGMATTNCR